ncbi:unnamed protein product [[Candida] boidinii]|nr:hypothetical protein BVG19_g5292 [[Candida] boidinii]OWB53812.1 hypothetical protein B5S27_g5421 [[Candida] boidinii]OWB86819.1 hypothetical protein B5S33_g5533 [[Candida] boidinii]GMF01779.1 unnamed protein product [[Candida] boidinii]
MSVIELEEYLRDSLSRINSSDISSMYDGLQSIDALFGKLCAVSDPNKRQPLSSISDSNSKKSSALNLKPSSSSSSSRQNSESPNTHSKLNETNDTLFEASASSTPSPGYTKNKIRSNKSLKPQVEKNRKVPNKKDPIFGQLLKTQDNFEFNIASNLLFLLLKMGLSKDYPSEFYTLTLKILQGCLLLHPDSRKLFVREMNMQLLLNLLRFSNNPEVIVSAIQTLVACLVRNIPNLRIFERLNGLEIICKLMKHKQRKISPTSSSNSHIASATSTPLHHQSSTPINKICSNFPEKDSGSWRAVQVKAVEFLFFYLVPETRSIPDHIHESVKNSKNSSKSNTKSHSASSSPRENQENSFPKGERNENLSSSKAHRKSLSSSSSNSNSSSSLLSYNGQSSSSSSSSISSKDYETSTKIYKDGYVRRTTSEKVDVLRQFLNKQTTDDLVKNLIENRPFGGMNIEW